MNETERLVADSTRRIFHDLAAPQAVLHARDGAWRAPLWQALEEAGLTRALAPDGLGGAGLAATEAFAALRVAGEHAVAVPLAETMLAAWLLAAGGLTAPDGPLAVAPGTFVLDGDGRVTGSANAVAFGREAAHIALLAEAGGSARVALLARAEARVTPEDGMAGEPRDDLAFVAAPALAHAPAALDGAALQRMGAAMRAMQVAGAMQGALDLCLDYAQGRVAFGRPIGGFQAVQHLLARLAEEAAAALAAANSAAYAIEAYGIADPAVFVEVAAAKVRCGEAAGEAALIAHQVHGAIGFTDEHPLHRFVQRLWQWRDDFGGEAEWAAALGRHFAAQGSGGFWPALTAV